MSVLTRIMSPVLTNGGTCTTSPVSSVAGLTCALAVAPLMPGASVGHLQVHGGRQLDADGLFAVELDLDGHFRLQVVHRSPSASLAMLTLLERRGVHEAVAVAVEVEILHLLFLERCPLQRVFRPQLLVAQRAVADVPELDADEAAQVAWGDMLELEDPEEVLLDLDQHAAS